MKKDLYRLIHGYFNSPPIGTEVWVEGSVVTFAEIQFPVVHLPNYTEFLIHADKWKWVRGIESVSKYNKKLLLV